MVKVPTTYWQSVWIWNGDGRAMTELGRLAGQSQSGCCDSTAICCLEWLPNSHKVSFKYEQYLYTLDTDARQ
jgi:hypothetical protein